MSRWIAPSALAATAAGLAVVAVATGAARDARISALVPGAPAGPSPLARLGGSRVGEWVRPRSGARRYAGSGWTAEEIAGARLLGAVGIAALALVAPSSLIFTLPAGLALLRLPALAVWRSARRRYRAASLELPLFLDLLAVATSAGLGPQLAVRAAVEPVRGPLAAELREAIRTAGLGRPWHGELEAAVDRIQLPDLRRAVILLRRSQTHGSSLAEEMQRLAADVRDARRSRAVERARLAPVKMLFPLVFLILPAFLLLTVVPVLLSTVRSIG